MEEFLNSLFKQTAVAKPEQLENFPENILSLVHNYTQGKLVSTSSEEVSDLLKAWFEGTFTKEIGYTPCDIDVGLESGTRSKRQRVNCDI
jgi:hypothetical protein